VFRPCIDLHEGKVKQIVGGTLSTEPGRLQTNFVSNRPAAWYAELYRRDGISLNPKVADDLKAIAREVGTEYDL